VIDRGFTLLSLKLLNFRTKIGLPECQFLTAKNIFEEAIKSESESQADPHKKQT